MIIVDALMDNMFYYIVGMS